MGCAIDNEIAGRYASTADRADLLVALFDPGDRLRHANPAFCQAFGVEASDHPTWLDIMRHNHEAGCGTVAQTLDFEHWLASARSRRGKQPFRAFEADLADGRWIWMTETTDADGWMLCIGSDITALRSDDRALRQDRDLALRAAQTDALTGIANRRYVLDLATRLIGESYAGGLPMSLCLLDIDLFKQINDIHGHQSGDTVLVDFSRRISALVRQRDGFGRIGGEEFMLLLPSTMLETARGIVSRMLEVVRQAAPLPQVPCFRYSCSAGLAALMPGDTIETLYARADAALYAAKQAGRDQVVTG